MKKLVFGKALSLIIVTQALVSCAGMFEYKPYARNVQMKPKKEGIIALHQEHRQEDKDLASSMMSQNCAPKAPEVQSEGEVVIGTTTQSSTEKRAGNEQQVGKFLGMPVMSGDPATENQNSTTLQKKEWQIAYLCK
jgi:hypothetical protein